MWPFKRRVKAEYRGELLDHWTPVSVFGGKVIYSSLDALRVSTLHRCIQIIAGTIATLPIHIYMRGAAGNTPKPKHPLQSLLYEQPNRRMTPAVFWQTVAERLVLGNAYIEVIRDESGKPLELWPLMSNCVQVNLYDNGIPYYTVTINGETTTLSDADVMHIPGPGYDGYHGQPLLEQFATIFGISLNADELAKTYFQNGAKSSGVLETPENLSVEAEKRFVDTWRRLYEGVRNAGKTMILQSGMKYKELSQSFADAEYTKIREFQVAEVCRVFGVPTHMVMGQGGNYSSDEARSNDFDRYTLRPWLVRIEQAIIKSLIMPYERGRIFARFEVDGLLRADINKRYASYATAKQNGWLNTNEIRAYEDMMPIEGGDVYLVPLNMVPSTQLDDQTGDGEPTGIRK